MSVQPTISASACRVPTSCTASNTDTITATFPRTGEFYIFGAEGQSGDHARSRFHPASIVASQRSIVLRWCQDRGVLLILREIRSCYRCIQLRRRTGRVLSFEAVRQSVPPLRKCDDSANRIDRHSYIAGIQALERERPWLTLSDVELFLQGWFQADRCMSGNVDTQAGKAGKVFLPSVPLSRWQVAPQSSRCDPLDPLA
jgi:hypothetical protein